MAPKRKSSDGGGAASVVVAPIIPAPALPESPPLDPPKKPLSAFMLFANDRRPAVRASSAELSFKGVALELGRLWKELPEDAKKPYHEQAQQLKAGYVVEKAKYAPVAAAAAAAAAGGDGGDGGGGKASRPVTALHLFVAERELDARAALADPSDLRALAAALAPAYAALPETQRAALEAQAAATTAAGGGGVGGRSLALSDAARARWQKKRATLQSAFDRLLARLRGVAAPLETACALLREPMQPEVALVAGMGGSAGPGSATVVLARAAGAADAERGDGDDDARDGDRGLLEEDFGLLAEPALSAPPAVRAASVARYEAAERRAVGSCASAATALTPWPLAPLPLPAPCPCTPGRSWPRSSRRASSRSTRRRCRRQSRPPPHSRPSSPR